MPDVTFSPEDILASAELPAGWYPMNARSISEGPGKADPTSTTWACEFEIIDGPSKGAVIPHWFSSKMQKALLRFVRCFVSNVQPGVAYPLDSTVGKPVMGYVVYDLERQGSVLKDFKPIGK